MPSLPEVHSPPHRLFLVDDHPLFLQGLLRFLEAEGNWEVCGSAGNMRDALDKLREIKADLAIVDISLPGSDGLELIKNLRTEHPDLKILVLSVHDEERYALRALRAGASGYVMKKEALTALGEALEKVLAGGVAISSAFREQIIYKVARPEDSATASPLDVLSNREIEVLKWIGDGKSTREIAVLLGVSGKTVESHRLHLKTKLGFRKSAEMVHFATEFVAQTPL